MTKECCERLADDLAQECKDHPSRFDCPDALIVKGKFGYGLIVHDGGSSSIDINFCPWCGSKLSE